MAKIKEFSLVKRPMLFAAVLAAGFSVLSFYYTEAIIPSIIFVVSLSFVILIFYKRTDVFVALILVAVTLLLTTFTYSKIDRIEKFSGKKFSEQFVAVSDAETTNGLNFEVYAKTLSGKRLPKNTKIIIEYRNSKIISCGDVFGGTAKFKKFDEEYKKSHYADGEYLSAYLTNVYTTGEHEPFYTFVGKVRNYIINSVFEYLNGDTAATLIAMTCGNKNYLSKSLAKNVKITGVSHVLVVSGLHLSILLGAAFAVINKLIKGKFSKFLVSCLLVLFIAGVCGFTMSILRAGVMFLIASAAPLFSRENESSNTLGTAVIVVLMLSPFAVFSVSFQLSVLATYAIVSLAPFYGNLLIEKLKITNIFVITLISVIINTVFATIVTTPVLIHYFGYVSIIAPITNLLITYAVTAALTLTALALVIPNIIVLSFIRKWVFVLSGLCSAYIDFVINSLANNKFASVDIKESYIYAFVILILFLIVLMYVINYQNEKNAVKEVN